MKNGYISLALLAMLSLAACGEEAAEEPIGEAPTEEGEAVEEEPAEGVTGEEPVDEEPAEEASGEELAEEETAEEEALTDPVPEGLETEIINEAEEAEFEALAAGDYGDEVIYVTGKVAGVENAEVGGATFTLEAEGGEVVVSNMTDIEVIEGDEVVVYGTFGGEDEASGLPSIVATVITGVTE